MTNHTFSNIVLKKQCMIQHKALRIGQYNDLNRVNESHETIYTFIIATETAILLNILQFQYTLTIKRILLGQDFNTDLQL